MCLHNCNGSCSCPWTRLSYQDTSLQSKATSSLHNQAEACSLIANARGWQLTLCSSRVLEFSTACTHVAEGQKSAVHGQHWAA